MCRWLDLLVVSPSKISDVDSDDCVLLRVLLVLHFFLLCCSPLYYSLENVRLYILVERYVVVYVDWKAGYYSLERSSIDVEANAIDVC